MTNLGFVKQPMPGSEWDGPVLLEFSRRPDYAKTRTARYECQVEDRKFDFYAPLFMLRHIEPEDVPLVLLVASGRSPEPGRTLGFQSQPRPLRLESDACEYALSEEEPVNSKRYDFVHEGQTYGLYIPNSVFGGQRHPKRVWVEIGVPVSSR